MVVNFKIQSKNNPAKIYVRIRDGRNLSEIARTLYVVNPNDWSNKNGGNIKNKKDAELKNLNVNLNNLKAKIISEYNKAINNNDIIDKKWLERIIHPTAEQEIIPDGLINFFDYFLRTNNNLTDRYRQKFNRAKAICVEVQKLSSRTFRIKNVDIAFKGEFDAYCNSQSYSRSYAEKVFSIIKTLCNNARMHGIEINNQIYSFRKTKNNSIKITLSEKEIEQIESIDISIPHLDAARDWLIISCETGQRVSDFLKFTMDKVFEEIEINEDNKTTIVQYIEFEQQKTKKKLTLPLSRRVRKILEKNNNSFPKKMTSQRFNLYIKEVCKLAGLTEPIEGVKRDPISNRNISGSFPKYELITSHIGRRSYATNRYFTTTPISIIRAGTGHSSEKELLNYIGKPPRESHQLLRQYTEI